MIFVLKKSDEKSISDEIAILKMYDFNLKKHNLLLDPVPQCPEKASELNCHRLKIIEQNWP